MRGTKRALAGAVMTVALAASSIVAASAATAGTDPTSTTTTSGAAASSTTVPQGDAATFTLADGPALSCDPAVTEATDTYVVTKAAWATDLIVIPHVQAEGMDLVFSPAELGPGVTTATASITYPTPGGHSSRGATGSLTVLNADRTPAASGDVPVGFVGAIYCPATTSTTTVPAEPDLPAVAPAAAPVAGAPTFTG